MDLNEIVVFARVVQARSFTAAARALAMPKSTVSRRVSELEERLGARLLQRTTRKLSLTDAGRTYYQHATRIVSELEEADLAMSKMQGTPRGLLRVTAPVNFTELGPIVSSFLARYPDVQVDMHCTDRVVDLVDDGYDVGIRAGRLADSTLIGKSLGTVRSVLAAAPAFVKKHGAPKKPQDLERLPALAFGVGADPGHWRLVRKDREITVALKPVLVANDMAILLAAALAGLGVTLLPELRGMESVRAKRLQILLPEWCSAEVPIHAVYPSARLLSPKVKTFVDHLRQKLEPTLRPRP